MSLGQMLNWFELEQMLKELDGQRLMKVDC